MSYTEKSSIMNGMRKFTTTYYKLSSNGKFPEGNGFRLAFISDLHNMEFGPDNTVLKAVIDEAAPDLVIIGGDQIVAKPGENLDPGLSFAERLAEEYQVIYGCGNHEYRLKLYPEQYGDLYEKLRERLKKAGICYLENETADLTISGCPVRIYGYAMDRTYYNRFYRGPLPVSELTDHLGKPDPARYGILLAHHPCLPQLLCIIWSRSDAFRPLSRRRGGPWCAPGACDAGFPPFFEKLPRAVPDGRHLPDHQCRNGRTHHSGPHLEQKRIDYYRYRETVRENRAHGDTSKASGV